MARLPQPGGDSGQWGDILNDYLTQSHAADGSLKPGIVVETNLDAAVVTKLNTAGSVADGSVTTVKLADGAITDDKVAPSAAIAQSKVANLTSDIAGKVDKVAGKGLSTEDYGTGEKSKLAGIAPAATANASDAALRDRATHTGTQPIAATSGLQAALDGKAAATSVDVDSMRDPADPDDTASFQRAINAAIASGFKTVTCKSPTYSVSYAIDISGAEGLTIEGAGMGATVINASGTSSPINAVFRILTAGGVTTRQVTFRGFTVAGLQVDDVTTVPRRSRTHTGNGFDSAFQFNGDLTPSSSYGVVRDIWLDHIEVRNGRGLPWWFRGVRGEAKATSCLTHNTMDAGWTWSERAICIGNTSRRSADNGFSLSRGNQVVIATGNIVDTCAYYGVWISGFLQSGVQATDKGPTNFSVTGNVVTNAGWGGIHADDGPQGGSIVGNTVIGVLLGPSDGPSNLWGCGIYIGGYPSNNRTTPTVYAYGISVAGNTLINCARGGVQVVAAQRINVVGNTIINPGSAFRADGTTTVLSTDLDYGFGVAVMVGAQGTVSDLSIKHNMMIDDRGSPVANYPWYTSGSTRPEVEGNKHFGFRQAANVVADNTAPTHSNIHTFQANAKYSGGATAGSNAGTGTIAGFDTNGAATSVRPVRWLTGGVDRWHLRANGDSESGSNAGSNLEIVSRDDSGTLLHTLMQWMRQTGMTLFQRGTARKRVVQTLAANGAVAVDANAGDIQSITLQANATSSTITGGAVGQRLTITWIQDGTGSRTYAWPATCKFATGSAPAAATAANHRDSVVFEYDGANWFETGRAVAVR